LTKTVRLTGQILGDAETRRANEYCDYLDANIQRVAAVVSSIPQAQRPTIYHISSGSDPVASVLRTDGRNTVMQNWIETSGGTNVAADSVDGNGKTVSVEQLLAWNPDVIIVGAPAAMGEAIKSLIMTDSKFGTLKAVKDGKVFINPFGVFGWDRYGTEQALQLLWVAKTLYPDKFANLDAETDTILYPKPDPAKQ
jgi:iron complex transport system substrate-binding protein